MAERPAFRQAATAAALAALLPVLSPAHGQEPVGVAGGPVLSSPGAAADTQTAGSAADPALVEQSLSEALDGPAGEGPRGLGLLPGLGGPEEWTKPERLSSSLQVMLLLTVISLAPAVLLMTTSFVRIVVVLGLLRQALGTQQLPPSQVITSIALFVTLLLMAPVWQESYEAGVKPYSDGAIGLEEAFGNAAAPIRRFMADQIQRTGNDGDVYLFLQYLPGGAGGPDREGPDREGPDREGPDREGPDGGEAPPYVYYDPAPGEREVPLTALLPAFMLSELKTAFLIGFQIYLPFVILDIVVASVTISMGMLMLPPVLISLPFKLLLFVLLDGWRLVIEMLLESFTVFV